MALGLKFSPDTARTWRFRARPYGTSGYGETILAVREYTVAAAEGADGHCQPMARALTAQRMFDWLDERLADPR